MEAARLLDGPRCFTDGHAEMAISGFYTLQSDLKRIDWDVMNAVYWNDTAVAPDRKRRRQAEYLVHQRFPWTSIKAIGVIDVAMAEQVAEVIAGAGHLPQVQVQRGWYY